MPPSVFTPFFRRFSDEKSLELQETEALYRRVAGLHHRYADKDAVYDFALGLFRNIEDTIPYDLRATFFGAVEPVRNSVCGA